MGYDENSTLKISDTASIARRAVSILIEKKALDVRLYEVGEDNPLTDFYVNATGRSHTQVGALADELVDKLIEVGVNPLRVEGRRGDAWILVDYGGVIVNVFDRESREFYNLDRLMPQESIRDISDIVKEVDEKLSIT
ncbi:MAG: ribosome silencing factor [Clostridia bacterium]|nr:ribosome silencing factor [Clostridia bacterium]